MMSTKIRISPEQLREVSQRIKAANDRVFGNITNRFDARNDLNQHMIDEKTRREDRLLTSMFGQIDNATGLTTLLTSFTDSYNMRSENSSKLNRARHLENNIPSSIISRFMDRLPTAETRSGTRWWVGGNLWLDDSDRAAEIRREYRKVATAIEDVVSAVRTHRERLQGFVQRYTEDRYHTSSSRTANRAFISRLNYMSDYAIEAFVGIDQRSSESDGIVASVRNAIETTRRNMAIVNALGVELSEQGATLAEDVLESDRSASRVLSGMINTMSHAVRVTRSEVDIAIYRPELLSDNVGLENARSYQRDDRHSTLASKVTESLYEVAEFIARPGSRLDIPALCEDAISVIDVWTVFINSNVSVATIDKESTSIIPQWNAKQPLGILADYLPRELQEEIEAARRILAKWGTDFATTRRRADRMTTRMNNDTHLNRLEERVERAIYPDTALNPLQRSANQSIAELRSLSAAYTKFSTTVRSSMLGFAAEGYAGALDRGSRYIEAVAQTLEMYFFGGEFKGGVDGTSAFTQRTIMTNSWTNKLLEDMLNKLGLCPETGFLTQPISDDVWRDIEYLLSLSFYSMTPDMFIALTALLAELDAEGFERFLGYLVYEGMTFDSPSGESGRTTHWHLCVQKMSVFQSLLSFFPNNDDSDMSIEQRQSILGTLIDGVLEGGDDFLIGFTNRGRPNFEIVVDEDGVVQFSVPEFTQLTWSIHPLTGGGQGTSDILNHQIVFNDEMFASSGLGLVGNTVSELTGAGLGVLAGSVGGPAVMIVINTAGNVVSDQQNQRNRNTFNQNMDAARITNIATPLHMNVVITIDSRGNAVARLHPTDATRAIVAAMNACPDFLFNMTLEEILNDPLAFEEKWFGIDQEIIDNFLCRNGFKGEELCDLLEN